MVLSICCSLRGAHLILANVEHLEKNLQNFQAAPVCQAPLPICWRVAGRRRRRRTRRRRQGIHGIEQSYSYCNIYVSQYLNFLYSWIPYITNGMCPCKMHLGSYTKPSIYCRGHKPWLIVWCCCFDDTIVDNSLFIYIQQIEGIFVYINIIWILIIPICMWSHS